MPFCNECGAEYTLGDTFCGDCGIALKPIPIGHIPAPLVEEQKPAKMTGPLSEESTSQKPQEVVSPELSPVGLQSVQIPIEEIVEIGQPQSVESVSSKLVVEPIGENMGVSLAPEKAHAESQPQIIAQEEPIAVTPISVELPEHLEELKDLQSEKLHGEIIQVEPSEIIVVDEKIEEPKQVSEPVASVSVIERTKIEEAKVEEVKVDAAFEPTQPSPIEVHEVSKVETPQPVILEETLPPQAQIQPAQQSAKKREEELYNREISEALSSVKNKDTGDKRRSAVRQLREGTILNMRYEIVKRIGGGGMGAVYLAKDRNLGGAPRAVKEMLQSHLDEAQQIKAVEDFKRESLLLTSLEHPSIPTIYDYFYDEFAGRFYLVMKYVSGGDIAAHLRNAPGGRIDELTVARWGMETADVLDYLHTRQPPIIYRDLKPANLMVDGNTGRIMLIDFGIARWVHKEEKGVTAVGTMGYAPPELFSGKAEPRTDVYSLGATMFHLLTGTDPQDNPLLIFDFTKNPSPRNLNPAMSVEMEQILMHAVEYKPENRFRSAGEMRDALRLHLDKLARGELTFTPISQRLSDTASASVEMVFCGICGGRIAVDDLYCAHCGKPQPLAGVVQSAGLKQRVTAKLVVAGTTEIVASEFALLKDTNLIGRSDPQSNIFPEVDLTRYDPSTKVSRRHARIWRQGETYLVEDLGSVNGTVVFNRTSEKPTRLAPHQPQVIQSGDRIRLGETLLHFFVG
jgi:serine/threonine-protein kinase